MRSSRSYTIGDEGSERVAHSTKPSGTTYTHTHLGQASVDADGQLEGQVDVDLDDLRPQSVGGGTEECGPEVCGKDTPSGVDRPCVEKT